MVIIVDPKVRRAHTNEGCGGVEAESDRKADVSRKDLSARETPDIYLLVSSRGDSMKSWCLKAAKAL